MRAIQQRIKKADGCAQDAERVEKALAACDIELGPYPDENGYVPANLGICQDVMDAVTQPFIKE